MKVAEVAENVKRLVENPPLREEFIYELLLAYNTPNTLKISNHEIHQRHEKDAGDKENVPQVIVPNRSNLRLPCSVPQASRLPCSVPQASRLPEPEEPNDGKQAGRSLYDPDKMPAGLRAAHHNLDLAIDRLYRSKPFTSDEERQEHLFKLYEEMVAENAGLL